MKRLIRWQWFGLGLLWAVYAAYALWGVARVPFHPDESTYLYMSRDFDLLFEQGRPGTVTWQAPGAPADVVRYRLLDAPLAHYLPGLGRLLLGYAGLPLARDWDWSAAWDANVSAGALPSPGLLLAGRLPAALLMSASPLFVFTLGRRLQGNGTGLLAALLYGLNGMVWLHGRRAMSEGPLLFFMLLALWLAVGHPRRPALSGVAAALALAAKLNGLAVLPAALTAVAWDPSAGPVQRAARRWLDWLRPALVFVAAFVLSTALLSPASWASPLAGLRAMVAARARFNADQAGLLRSVAPGQWLSTPGQRALAIIYHGFYAPLAFWDVPNYQAETRAAEAQYLALPLHAGFRTASPAINLNLGTALLALTLIGLSQAAFAWARPADGEAGGPQRRALALLAVWTLATGAGLLALAVPWQRYYVGLVPISSLWASFGLVGLLRPLRLLVRRALAQPQAAQP